MAAGAGTSPGPLTMNPLAPAVGTNVQTTYNPLAKDILVIKGVSILDAIFIKKSRGKPAYITTTSDSSTALWHVGPTGDLREVAKVLWNAGPSAGVEYANASKTTDNGARIRVCRNGREEEAEIYGQRSKGIFSRSHCSLTVDGRKYSWHSGIGGSNTMRAPNTAIVDGWKCLVASEAPPSYEIGASSPVSSPIDMSTSRPPTATSTLATETNEDGTISPNRPKSIFRWNNITRKGPNIPKEIALRFIPPSSSLVHGEFILDPSLSTHTETFLISAILLATNPGDWKYTQSSTHPREMETVLRSDHAGDLPPYSPSTTASGSRGVGGVVARGRRPSHNLHRTISDSRQWRWSQDYTPGGRRRRSNSSSVLGRTE